MPLVPTQSQERLLVIDTMTSRSDLKTIGVIGELKQSSLLMSRQDFPLAEKMVTYGSKLNL